MKIFHITDHLPGYHKVWGGAEQAAYRIVKLLCRSKDIENWVITTNPTCSSMLTEDEKEFSNEDFRFHAIKSMEYYAGKRFEFLTSGFKNRGIPFDPVSFFSSYKLFRKTRPDLIHVHKANLLSFSVIQSAILLKIPVILSVYDYWYFCPAVSLVKGDGRLCDEFHGVQCIGCDALKDWKILTKVLLFFRWKKLFDYYYSNINAFIVLSESSANILKSYGINEKKIYVIHQVFPLKDWEASSVYDIEDNSILFAGWVDEKKGLHILIDAMPEILKKVPDAKLYVLELTSYKEYKNKILKKIDEYGLKNKVFMLGRLSPDEFKGYLKKANIVVVPEQWKNMSPVIIAEAMAKAKPIVASRIGSIPEFIEHGISGFLAEYNNPKDFAEKIIRILQDKNKAIEMGKKARQMALDIFDEKKAEIKLMELYKMVSREA
mgnify:CR=1 FL=1